MCSSDPALVVERPEDGKTHGVQRPVYYLSEVLSPAQQRYPHYQKLAYSVFMTTRKLLHYFDVHHVTVVCDSAIHSILNIPRATGRVLQWGIEIAPLDISYSPRVAIKSQILPDFISDWTELQTPGPPDLSSAWKMYFDGSKRLSGAGAGVILISPQGDKLRYVLRMDFLNASNNEAEYEALIHGMRMAKACGATHLDIYGDSNLVVEQTMKKCDATKENMVAYRALYNTLEGEFEGCELTHIGRESNEEADALANIGSTCSPVPPGVFFETIQNRSVKVKSDDSKTTEHSGATPHNPAVEQVLLIEPTWTGPYIAYLERKELPADVALAHQIVRRAGTFTLVNNELYKRSKSGILQRCITPEDGKALLRDIHGGDCGHHASSRAIVGKAYRSGFYWLTADQDAKDMVRRCEACQRFATKPHAPATELNMILVSWPFAQWGLDMVGPLTKSAHGGHTHLLVAVDKFTKWIEATPVTNQSATAAVNFFKGITCRFGVPHSIITDNGTNFASEEFKKFGEEMGISITFASVSHPQTNGQVEKANGLVCAGIKKRLEDRLHAAKGNWPEELPSVLWSLRTTPNTSTKYTPFFMVYGSEAVLPHDVRFEAPRVRAYTEARSTTALEDDGDLIDEARDIAAARSAVYQQDLRNYHSRRVRTRSFVAGDLVLRLKQKKPKKLESPWEGPYIVDEVIPGGAYRLKNPKTGKMVGNPWNVAQLRRFYA